MKVSNVQKFLTALVFGVTSLVVTNASAQQVSSEAMITNAVAEQSKQVASELQQEISKSIQHSIDSFRIQQSFSRVDKASKRTYSKQNNNSTTLLIASK